MIGNSTEPTTDWASVASKLESLKGAVHGVAEGLQLPEEDGSSPSFYLRGVGEYVADMVIELLETFERVVIKVTPRTRRRLMKRLILILVKLLERDIEEP